ncbi:FAD-dependent oxidoreductase (plasmid) [Mesorhizobium sp. ORM8.1]
MLEAIFNRMPALADLGIKTFFTGPESFTPDGLPYVGPAPEMPGLFIAAGMSSHGIMNSGGVGLRMAEWMIDGYPSQGMGSVLASRAHPFQANAAYNAERVTEAVGLNWRLHWPGRQIETARGIRRVPLHDRLAAAGAVFAEYCGWELPMYFDPKQWAWPTAPSLGWQEWSDKVASECIAARDGVALIDQSMYGKLLVQGPDAVKALNHVCGAQMDVASGVSVYTQFLNPRGGIEADVTVTRLGEQKFLVVTSNPIRDRAWIEAHADRSWRVEIFDATSAYSFLAIHGPHARSVIASITTEDVSNEAFPFGAAHELDLAYARGLVIRRSFLGELGYELMVPTEFTAGVYEALLQAGNPFGLRHIGIFAISSCRLEKAFRHFDHDIAEDDTPYETGLGFAVDLSKQEFLGKRVLEAQKAGGPTTELRTVCVAVDSASARNGPYLIHNEPVWRGGSIVGHVTSGGWGFRIERMVGLASVHCAGGVTKEWLEQGGFEVQIAGKMHPLAVQLQPFYDPRGERMRG